MTDFSKLKAMTQPELLNLARSQGLQVHHKNKPETLIEAIMNSLQPQAPQVVQTENVVTKPSHSNTVEAVEAAIAKIKERSPNLRTSYDDDVFSFQYVSASGRITREESGNINIPMHTIVQIATNIAKGPMALIGMNSHGFDNMVVGEKSAYTNTVLR